MMTRCRGVAPALAALMLIASEAAVSQANPTDTFAKGATDFLLDRANDQYVYIFQKKLEANPQLQKYLPATLRVVKAGDIQSLIMQKDLWREALEADLGSNGDRLFTEALTRWTGYVDRLCTRELSKKLSSSAASELSGLCATALLQVARVLAKWEIDVGETCGSSDADRDAKKEACDEAKKHISELRALIVSVQDGTLDKWRILIQNVCEPELKKGSSGAVDDLPVLCSAALVQIGIFVGKWDFYVQKCITDADPAVETACKAAAKSTKDARTQILTDQNQALVVWRSAVEKLCGARLEGMLLETAKKDSCRVILARLGRGLDRWKPYVDEMCRTAADAEDKNLCAAAVDQISKFREPIVALNKKISPATLGALADQRDDADRALVSFFSPGPNKALSDLIADLGNVKPDACRKLGPGKYTGCVIEILAILKAISHADYVVNCYLYGNMCATGDRDSQNANTEEDDDYKDFRRYALFFAQLADAAGTSDRAQVNALLKSVTVPPVSFGIKREPHATRVLVTAYVGGGWSWKTAEPHQQVWGLVAPVGVEISQARDSGNSLSLLVSPLDFAYPLTLKLKNTDATIKGSDVVVPSAYVFYGLKNYPVAAGLGYSRGRSIDNPDQRVGRILVVVAFDMPLFKLH